MTKAQNVLNDFLQMHQETLINDILDAIDKKQPEAFIKLAHQSKAGIYQEHIRQLVLLFEKYTVGESTEKQLEQWGMIVSEDKVRLGLSLNQSIQHFTIIRDVVWENVSIIAESEKELSIGESMKLGKIINDFIDKLILIFAKSYTGLANKRLRAQQEVINELSTPIISIVDGVAVLPIIGDIDTHRARLLMEHTLRETIKQEVDCLILDMSGVFIVDTMVAQELFKIIDSLKLTGVDVNITGVRPELAHSVVTLGINFDEVKMFNNLGQALKAFGIVRK